MSKSYVLVSLGWGERRAVLRRGDEEIGRIEYEGLLGARARATAPGGEWSFERSGVLKPIVTVRRTSDGSEVASLGMSGGDGSVLAFQGRMLRWKAIDGWRGEFGWAREDGSPAIVYRPRVSMRALEQHIEVLADDLDEPLLLFLGAYMTHATYSDVATTTAAIMAATIVS